MKINDIADIINVTEKDPATSGIDIFVGLEHYDIAEPVIKRFGSTKMLSTAAKKFETGDVLIARRNVYLQRASIARFAGLTSGDSIVLRVKKDLDVKGTDYDNMCALIPFILNSINFWDYANTNADGTMSKRLSPAMLLDYEFTLPPLAEQKVLAEKLWAAYEVKQSYLKMIAATEEMVKAQFVEMFNAIKKVGINTLVDTIWGASPDSSTYNDTGDGVPFYQGKTEFGELYVNNPITYCTAPVKMAKKDSILMSVRAPVGAVNIATQNCCIGRGLASITPKKEKAETMFIYYALKYMEEEINRLGTGSTFKAINKDSYAKIQLPEASSEDQIIFVEIAQQADKSISELRKSVDAIDKVIKSLINENL